MSFVVDGLHPHDVGPGARRQRHRGAGWTPLRVAGLPTVRRPATTRASFYVYNGTDDLDALVEGVVAAQAFFGARP